MRNWIKLVESAFQEVEQEINEDGPDATFGYHIGGMHYDMGIEGTLDELCRRAIKASQEVIITSPTGEFVALYRGGDLRLANPDYKDQVIDSKNPTPGIFHQANRG